MSLVYAAITPHPPILIPSIGKDNLSQLEKTQKSFSELEGNLYTSKAETLIIISPHGHCQTDAFTMNLNPKFEINFEEFGDFSAKHSLEGDIGNAYKMREHLETRAPLQLISEEKLDHGCGVPLYMLTQNIPNLKIIPLYYSDLSLEAHYNFGKLMQREIQVNKSRIAVIASGDLSHRLTKNAPAGYSSKGVKFDNKLMEFLSGKKTKSILNMSEKLISEAGECGLRSIIILLGILDGIEYKPETLSYEGPFGVGYLTMSFKL